MKFSMIEQEKGDLLIQVTANMIIGGSFDCIQLEDISQSELTNQHQ
jgi:hypothetical protein